MMTSEKILMTLPGGAVIEGDFIATRITPDTPGLIGLHGITGMAHAETLEHDEIIDVVEAGTCLVEDPDGSRWVIRIKSGKMQGPFRVLEIEDILPEAIEAASEPERRMARQAKRIDRLNALLAFLLGMQCAWLAPRLFDTSFFFGVAAIFLSLGCGFLTLYLLYSEKLPESWQTRARRWIETRLSGFTSGLAGQR